jgi:hypothetical protein
MDNSYEVVSIDLTHYEIFALALAAHNEGITLNDYIIRLVKDHIGEM